MMLKSTFLPDSFFISDNVYTFFSDQHCQRFVYLCVCWCVCMYIYIERERGREREREGERET